MSLGLKDTESNIYSKDSRPKVTDYNIHPSFGGCAYIKAEEYMKKTKDGSINSTK